jgi:hypothetical protein
MRLILILLAACAVAHPARAQDEERKALPDPKFYRLDFVLKELEAGKVTSSRTYSMNISPTQPFQTSSIRTGNNVLVPTGGENSFNSVNLNVNLDCRATKGTDTSLMLSVTADITTLIPTATPGLPVTNRNSWNVGATLQLRKATTLVSADGATNKRQMQLEVTATPLQ